MKFVNLIRSLKNQQYSSNLFKNHSLDSIDNKSNKHNKV